METEQEAVTAGCKTSCKANSNNENVVLFDNPEFRCPKCGAEIIAPTWGCGFDWDLGDCDKCGYSGELDTMTGVDPDGTVWQSKKEDWEDAD